MLWRSHAASRPASCEHTSISHIHTDALHMKQRCSQNMMLNDRYFWAVAQALYSPQDLNVPIAMSVMHPCNYNHTRFAQLWQWHAWRCQEHKQLRQTLTSTWGTAAGAPPSGAAHSPVQQRIRCRECTPLAAVRLVCMHGLRVGIVRCAGQVCAQGQRPDQQGVLALR